MDRENLQFTIQGNGPVQRAGARRRYAGLEVIRVFEEEREDRRDISVWQLSILCISFEMRQPSISIDARSVECRRRETARDCAG